MKNNLEEIKWNDKWRLGFHLMPPTGWLNDPNGLCQFKGEYHVFFQYTPDNPDGGMKYWGHYTSRDLLNWEYAGIALSPDEDFERNGVYSGSALIAEGKMNLYYTGNVKLIGDYNYITDGRQGNTVLVSSEDGITFEKKECLMTNEDYPSNLTCHVRDPKVVTGESIGSKDGNYYMFLGARTNKDEGEVLVYRSNTLKDWQLVNTISSEEKFGYMWECPDAFMLGNKKILSISPQGVAQKGVDYQNIYQAGYYEVVGDFDRTYQLNEFKEWDRGFDFYAPQSFRDEKGRRILIGWIGMPDEPAQSNPTVEQGWQNALTVPRDVFLQNGKVVQYPVEELYGLRKEAVILESGQVSEKLKMYDAEIELLEDTDITVTISGAINLQYSKNRQMFTVSFDQEKNIGHGRKERSVRLEYCQSIRILADTSCLEIYINHGEEVFTTRFYTEDGMSNFRITKGAASVTYWEMKPMKVVRSADREL